MSASEHSDPYRRWSTRRAVIFTCSVVALIVAALLVPVPFHGRVSKAIGDLAHAPIFCSLAIGALCLLDRFRSLQLPGTSLLVRCAAVGAGLFAFGVATEFAQRYVGRNLAVQDVVANGLGIAAGTLCYAGWRFRRRQPAARGVPRSMWGAAGFLLALAWWPSLVVLGDIAAADWDFPVLASFKTKTELGRFYFHECEGELTAQDATDGAYALEITYQPTPYPSASMVEMRSDWSEMKTLEMDVKLDAKSGADTVRFMVKILDATHPHEHIDTYRNEWVLKPGVWQHIRITRDEIVHAPRSRSLDLSQIYSLDLLVLERGKPTKLRVDAIHLTL